MMRKEFIRHIVKASETDLIISTTGKASCELFEMRVANGQSHKCHFLTVGSMGHSSSIALGIAVKQAQNKSLVYRWGGAILMHMGAMVVIGATAPKNMIYIIINNEAHETVGCIPTVACKTDFVVLAKACRYTYE